MEDTGDGSVEPEDPREWSPEKVATFVRALGDAQCFQSAGDLKYCFLEWMTVFSSIYPSTTCKVCVDITPPPSRSIIYYGTGSLMFTPPPDTPSLFARVDLSILYGKLQVSQGFASQDISKKKVHNFIAFS